VFLALSPLLFFSSGVAPPPADREVPSSGNLPSSVPVLPFPGLTSKNSLSRKAWIFRDLLISPSFGVGAMTFSSLQDLSGRSDVAFSWAAFFSPPPLPPVEGDHVVTSRSFLTRDCRFWLGISSSVETASFRKESLFPSFVTYQLLSCLERIYSFFLFAPQFFFLRDVLSLSL